MSENTKTQAELLNELIAKVEQEQAADAAWRASRVQRCLEFAGLESTVNEDGSVQCGDMTLRYLRHAGNKGVIEVSAAAEGVAKSEVYLWEGDDANGVQRNITSALLILRRKAAEAKANPPVRVLHHTECWRLQGEINKFVVQGYELVGPVQVAGAGGDEHCTLEYVATMRRVGGQ